MQNYKDLIVWKKAHALVLYVYKLTIDFPKVEQFSLTSQLRRAATSIPTNLAEGCGKYTQLDLANYLQTALGSSNEVEYLALLSHDLGYRSEEHTSELQSQSNLVCRLLLEKKKKKQNKYT